MSAFSEIKVQKLEEVNEFKKEASTSAMLTALATNGASSPTYGAYFKMDERDDKYLILVQNVAASGDDKTVTIKAGNGIQGVADIAKADLGFGEYTFIQVESGRVKNVTDNVVLSELSSATETTRVPAKGKVFITGTDANIKVAVFKLP